MKFCIFCGKTPTNKNNEHVIPQWLIKLTGDPKRVVNFGNDILEDIKTFDWSSFKFPSCTTCNDKYSEIEAHVKPIVEKLLLSKELTNIEALLLLDWMDKVRIGLWLGYSYLFEGIEKVNPKFFIDDRVAKKDRALIIHMFNKDAGKGINFFGPETPIFKRHPSCFGLRINNIFLVSISDDYLVSEICGFTPYPKKISITKDGHYHFSRFQHRYKKSRPRNLAGLHKGQIFILQPIHTLYKDYKWYHPIDIINNQYVDSDNKVGSIYLYKDEIFKPQQEKTISYREINKNEVMSLNQIIAEIYHSQIKLFTRYINKETDKNIALLVKYNKLKIRIFKSIDY